MPAHVATLLGRLLRLSEQAVPDFALLGRWTDRRDEAAFAELVARHGPMVLGVCRRVLGDVQLAEDAFQATFLVLARKAVRLRPESLSGFLYGVALRLAKKARGAQRRRPTQSYPTSAIPADPQPHPLDALSGRELLALIDEEVARLPETYRLPVLLCVLQERPVEEAARMLGWGVGSVRGRLARGKQRLRERLTRRGVCLSAGAVALLAPAAVPEHLRAASLRNLGAPAPPAVLVLAAKSAPTLKFKATCLGLLLAAAALGAGLPFLRAPEPESPPAPAPVVQAKAEPRRDRSGDPLPAGAVNRLGTLRFRAPFEIDSLAISPDGKTVAASSRAGVVLFDVASGKRIKTLEHSEQRRGSDKPLAFSPYGKRLAGRWQVTVGDKIKGVVRIWNLFGEGKPRDYDAENVLWLGWSAGGEPLAVCLEADSLQIRELASGTTGRIEGKDWNQPARFIMVVCACSADGKTLAVVDGSRRTVYVWDTATAKRRATFRPKGEGVFHLAVSPDGSKVASASRQGVQVWDVAKGEALYVVDAKDKYGSPQFSADGKVLAVVESSRAVCFWDAATGRERGRTRTKWSFSSGFCLSADGQTLVSSERHSGAIHLFDVATGDLRPEPVGHRNRPHGAAFYPDGRRVATGGTTDGTIHVWDLATGESQVRVERPSEWVRDIALSRDGRSLFSTWTGEELWVSDAATGKRRHVIKLEDPDRPDTVQSAFSMDLSGDGKTLVALSYYYPKNRQGAFTQDQLITGWDTSTRKQLFRRRLPALKGFFSSSVALAPDARVLAVSYTMPPPRAKIFGIMPLRLEEVATGELLLTFTTRAGQSRPLAFSPDGRLLIADHLDEQDGSLRVWETTSATEVLMFPAAFNQRVAFSSDGRLLAMSAPQQQIVVWDLCRDREARRFKGYDAEVTWLAFSPDGRQLVSGQDDSTILVWDVGPRVEAKGSKLGADGVAKAWADLAGADAPRAFRARGALAFSPEEAVALLKGRLRRAQPADPQRLRRLLADLGSDQFAQRTKAQAELEGLGDLAEPALRKELANNPTLEVRRRVQKVLEGLRVPVTRPELLRPLRAVAVLEDVATPAARELLQELAEGAPAARLTREATASLDRLTRRTPARR